MNFDRTEYIQQPIPILLELKALFNPKDKIIIFEIGACEGEDSIKYSRLFNNASIYAFEPLPENIKLIKNNLSKYGIKNVACYNKALSSKEGTAEFYVSTGIPPSSIESDWDFGNKSSSLLAPAKHLEIASFIKFNKKIEVETITIKSFCERNNINLIDFIHMDVQGAELMVLEGAGDYISSIKAIWLEVSKIDLYKEQPLVNDIKDFMQLNNFALIKDDLKEVQGDQLYISKKYYKKTRVGLVIKAMCVKSKLARIVKKLKFFKYQDYVFY